MAEQAACQAFHEENNRKSFHTPPFYLSRDHVHFASLRMRKIQPNMGKGTKSITHSRNKQKQRKRCLRKLKDHCHVEAVMTSGRPATPEVVKHVSEEDAHLQGLPNNDVNGDVSTIAMGGSSPFNASPGCIEGGAQSTVFYNDIEDFWRALDRKSEEFWKRYEDSIDDVKKCADFDSAIIEGPNNFTVTIQSDLNYGPLDKINYHEYIRRMKEKQDKLSKTIRFLRDRCENLELDIVQAKEEAKQAQYQAKIETDRIRRFWRNKIYEGGSRSGKLVRAALQNF